MPRNALYAQSGGVTPVINASAWGVISASRRHPQQIGALYVAKDGILGALTEQLIDIRDVAESQLTALRHTPGGAFGSCRHKLKHGSELKRLFELFAAYDIGYFFYNGGGDSADTCLKVAEYAQYQGIDLVAIHVPKTIDNNLPHTDCSPGFGSAAKYLATTVRECGLDLAAMSSSSTKVFILEVMGRHTGWLAAATGLASRTPGEAPHIILLPEVAFEPGRFLRRVRETIDKYGSCVVVAAEGIRDTSGVAVAETGPTDPFGHVQLGGVAPLLANLVKSELRHKCHWAVADYMQRAARHLASGNDVEQAIAVGEAAVDFAIAGQRSIMPAIVREADQPYRWHIDPVSLKQVANKERGLPFIYLNDEGTHLSTMGRAYFAPLILGESPPPFEHGLPDYPHWHFPQVAPRLPPYQVL